MSQAVYKQPNAVLAANGYPQVSGNLTHPVMADRLIDRFYNTTDLTRITDTSYYGPIMNQGDTVRYFRTPKATVQPYTKDGYIKPQTLEAETFTLRINRALAYALKVDCIDEYQMQLWPRFREGYLENVSRKSANFIERQVMAQAVFEAHPANRGQRAGCKCSEIDLGAPGAPVLLTAKNILIYLSHLSTVLDEQEVPQSERFVIFPYQMRTLLMAALGSASFTGAQSSSFMGNQGMMMMRELVNFDIIFSPNISHGIDKKSGKKVFNMMFGHKSAIAFATQLVKTKVADTVENFDTYIMGLQVYGFGVALPEALGNLYACIDPTPEILCCG